jgi:hypothetical protein
MSDTDGRDEQILAWDAIARHPFFRDCYESEGPLLTAMLAKLSAITPRTVEWGVQFANGIGGINIFPDLESCRRFIDQPGMSEVGELAVLSRLTATDWEPFTPTDAGSES